MNNLNVQALREELDLISNSEAKAVAEEVLAKAPECFATIPASSSRKYHSEIDCRIGTIEDGKYVPGGLVYHTKAVTRVCTSLMLSNAFRDIVLGQGEVTDEDFVLYQDAAIIACILHDCCKALDEDPKHQTRFDHPLQAAKLFQSVAESHINPENISYMRKFIPLVYNSIASHMNKWNTSKYMPDVTLPVPQSGLEVYVSMCDYIGSRSFLEFNPEAV